jgi:predicted molibdopterin-dependent oxidoreductase YjgC
VGWDEAIALVASELRAFKKSEVAAVGSAYATNEDNYLFQKFAGDVLGTKNIDFVRHVVEGDEDDILIRADKTPNSRGAEEVGVRPRENGMRLEGILKSIREGQIKALYVIEDDIAADPAVAKLLTKLEYLVVHSAVDNEMTKLADVTLPSATYAEKHGTFTNFQGKVQRVRPSVATLDRDRVLEGFASSRLDKFGTAFDRWARGVKHDARPSWRIIAGVASLMGAKYRYTTVEEVFNELASTVPAFKGMTYRKIGTRGMMLGSGHKVSVTAPA